MKTTLLKSFILVLITSLSFSCEGPQGEIGPKGDPGDPGQTGATGASGQNGAGFEKRGYIQGTVSGNRTDGTAFSESFKYEYGPAREGFIYDYSYLRDVFITYRSLDLESEYFNNRIRFDFGVDKKGTANESLISLPGRAPLDFEFSKELTGGSVFVILARAITESKVFEYPVNPTLNNSTYKFTTNGLSGRYETYIENSVSPYVFTTSDGKLVYFQGSYENTDLYDNDYYYYGSLVKVTDLNGNNIAPAPYDQLRLCNNNTTGDYYFRNISGLPLSSTVTLPADSFTISNYKREAATGIISFDFSTTIGTVGRPNTTKNPLTISGSYVSGGKVSTSIVSRQGN